MMDRFYQSERGDASFINLFYYEEVYGKAKKDKQQAMEELSQAWYDTAFYIYLQSYKKSIQEPIYWAG